MQRPQTNAIEVTGLTKRFGSKLALDKVSFHVPKGSIFGFLGPNGAGKTTTIRCLMDYIRPTGGTLTVLGNDAHTDSTELKSRIGFLSSDSQLNPHWTVNDHIKLFASSKGKNDMTDGLVKLLDLDVSAKVKNLSSGNMQKLAVVLAFAGDPELLIMDEPTRGLDPMLQNVLYELLVDFAKSGKTVFFSSHNLAEVQRVCDAVVLIKDGKVVTEKSMEDIRGLNTHIVSATATTPFKADEFAGLPGVAIVTLQGHEVVLKVKGDLNPALHVLFGKQLTDLSVAHASLEDIFLEMYKE